jgi:hypothetical protein
MFAVLLCMTRLYLFFPVGDFGIPPESLNELSNQFSKEKYFWIACQSQTAPYDKELDGWFSSTFLFFKVTQID